MGASFSFGFLLMVIVGGGGGELMDYIDTKTYWQQQGIVTPTVEVMAIQLKSSDVPDLIDAEKVAALIAQMGAPGFAQREAATNQLAAMGPAVLPQLKKATEHDDAEIALRAENLIAKITGTDQTGDPGRVRRLMAIRTLGELGDQKAVAVLTPVLASDQPFEAEYAKLAIAKINGEATKPHAISREQLDADLALLPAKVGIVAQQAGMAWQTMSLDKMLADFQQMPMAGDMGMDPAQMKQQITEAVTQAVARVGNARLDAVTLGVAEQMNPNQGFVVVIARGRYDLEAVKASLANNGFTPREHEGVAVYRMDDEVALIPVNDQQLVVVIGGKEGLPLAETAKAIKAGKGTLSENQAMSKLIAAVDKTAALWAVAKMSDSYKVTPFTQAFDTVVLTGQRTEEDAMALVLTAKGDDSEQVGAATEMISQQIKQAIEEIKPVVEMIPMLKTYQNMLEKIDLRHNEGTMIMKATLPANAANIMGMGWFGAVSSVRALEARPQ